MKTRGTSIIFALLLCLSAQLNAQTTDSIVSEKDNLYLLVERIYLAAKANMTGTYGFDKVIVEDAEAIARAKEARVKELKKLEEETGAKFMLPGSTGIMAKERPFVVWVVKGEKETLQNEEGLKKIPISAVKSIELIVDPSMLSLFGIKGANRMISVKLKEDKVEE